MMALVRCSAALRRPRPPAPFASARAPASTAPVHADDSGWDRSPSVLPPRPRAHSPLGPACGREFDRRVIDISTVLAELRPDEVLPENVAQRVQLPKNARVDDRQRIILIDGDFEALIACPDVHAELHTVPP